MTLPPILTFLCGGFVDGEVHAVLVILAEVGDAAGQRTCVTDLDGDGFLGGGGGAPAFGRFGLLGFFLAATVNGYERGRNQRQAERMGDLHERTPPGGNRLQTGYEQANR